MAGKYQVRSISLPSRAHPASVRIEQELNSLKSWEFSSSASSSNEVCSLLAGLEEAYNCADGLVSMQSACSKTLSNCEIKRWASDSWFDGSVKLLDVCSSSRETMLMAKGHVQDIQSALRRRNKGDSSIQKSISGYLSFRKQMSKSATKMIALLKQINQASATTSSSLNDDSSRLMIKMLQDVTEVTVSVFESLLTFLAAPSCAKATNKWSMASRLMMTKRAAVHDVKAVNEFACADAVMFQSGSSQVSPLANAQVVLERLEALEVAIRGIDDRLEGMFRCLVTLRVSFLNRMSS